MHDDLYTALVESGPGLAQLSAAERAAAAAQGRTPVFKQRVVPFDIDDGALAADTHGRVWVAVLGRPAIAVFDTATGQVKEYQYAAPSIAGHPPDHGYFGKPVLHPAPGAVWLRHIVAMTTDGQGHLWYVRGGYDSIEEVAA